MTNRNSKHTGNKKSISKKNKRNKGYGKLAIIIVLILIAIFIIRLKSSNDVTISKNEDIQIILNNENITSNIIKDIIVDNNKIYMSYEDIKNIFDATIYQEENGLIITTSDKSFLSITNATVYNYKIPVN